MDSTLAHQANVDARRSLGVRNGARPRTRPNLRLDDSALHQALGSEHNELHGRPSSPRSPIASLIAPSLTRRERDFSGATSTTSNTTTSQGTGEGFRRLRRPSLSRGRFHSSLGTEKSGQYETQKLLSHLLDRLEARQPAPDLLDRAALTARHGIGLTRAKTKPRAAAFGDTVAAVGAAALGHKATSSVSSVPPEDGEEELGPLQEGEWNIDDTYDMVGQMRDLLVLAEKQSLDLFGASSRPAAATNATTHRRRGSLFASSPLAKSSSHGSAGHDPFEATITVSGPELLHRLADMVRSLLTVDCLYKTTKVRPEQPPYALQAVCLDVAAVLYHKGDLKLQLAMMDAVVDGLYSMGDVLREKVCEWLEGRLAEMLRKLAKERSASSEEKLNVDWVDPFAESPSPTVPTFAFSVHPGDEDELKENADNSKPGWMRVSPKGSSTPLPRTHKPTELNGILSTHTASGSISAAAIQIAAIVPHILVAVTSTVDLRSSNLMTVYRVHRLISLVLTAKPDAALDLLEIIAHGPSQTRTRGMDILYTFYPECVGHNVIARRPALATYQAHRSKWESGKESVLGEDDTEGHVYIPWRASDDNPITCAGCHRQCLGFCVRCTLCGDAKHTGCLQLYQEETFQYNVISPSKTEVVHVQFSKCIARLDEKVLGGGSTKGTTNSTLRKVGQHHLVLVNLFNITLCAECHEPLWGSYAQAYACMGVCQGFFHVTCADMLAKAGTGECNYGFDFVADPDTRDPFSASAAEVRASFQKNSHRLYRDPDHLEGASFDEVAVLYCNLWIQNEILNNGIASGSLRIQVDEGDYVEDVTGLGGILLKYKAILDQGDLPVSPAVGEFAEASGGAAVGWDFLWKPRYMQYCAALLRAPSDPSYPQPPPSPSGLLTVDGFPSLPDPPSVAYEAVQMSTIRRTLASDLNLRGDLASAALIEQMSHLGLCSIADTQHITAPVVNTDDVMVNFPLPLLMDSSPSVELLVLVIEQLLDDIDLTANEQGFSLLFNRAWPSSMCSPYALERLGASVISWIMATDDVLHHIVKNYASKRKRPPGVRTTTANAAKGLTSVQSYKDDRAKLRDRYARPWLQALHDEDPAQYAELAYERSKVIDDRWGVVVLAKGDAAASQVAGMALERITTLADAGVTFSITLDLLTAWLEDIGDLAHEEAVFKALPRLLKHTHTLDKDTSDLWMLAHETSSDDSGLQRVCRWMRVLASSGAEVPWESITALMDLDSLANLNDTGRFDLVLATSSNTTHIAVEAHAEIVSRVFANVVMSLEERRHGLNASVIMKPSEEEIDMLRTGMLSLLRAYEVTNEDIVDSALHNSAMTPKQMASHRRRNNQPLRTKLIPLNADAVLAAAKLLRRPEYPAEMVLDFIWLLIKSPAADNPDGFLYSICSELYEAIWPLYDRTVKRRSRARLFLRLLVINSNPIERMVQETIGGIDSEVIRERLFSFALELADERVTKDVSHWRRAAVGLIFQLLNQVIPATDPSPQSLVMWRGLLPIHLHAFTLCFEEHLEFGNDEQRLTLFSQLLNLQTLIPSWPILGWHAIEQVVSEQVTTIQRLEDADTVLALAAVADAWTIRAAALALGMNMLAAGVPCQWAVLLRFQQHAAAACDLPWPTPCDSITSIMLPALKTVLDSPHHVGQSEDERKKTALVGSHFVSLVINFASTLVNWDYVVQRNILDILYVVFFKHNIQSVELQVMSTLQTLAHYAHQVKNPENGILAVQVLRTAQARMERDKISKILPLLFVHVADLLIRQNDNGDSAFCASCRSFLQESLSEFGNSGLLMQVLRFEGNNPRPGREPSHVGQAVQLTGSDLEGSVLQAWIDQLFGDLPELSRRGRRGLEDTSHPLANFICTLKDPLSEESTDEWGQFISRLTKSAAEWTAPSDFDPNPILRACATVLKLAPASHSATLLHQTSAFLHQALSRYGVLLADLSVLLPISVDVARKTSTENTVATVLFEVCGNSSWISGPPMTALTLTSILEFLATGGGTDVLSSERQSALVTASRGSMNILLRTHPIIVSMQDPNKTMRLLDAAADVIVRAETVSPGNIGSIFAALPSEVSITQVHVFGHILYASLPLALGHGRGDLVSLYPVLARATALTMFAWSDLLSVWDSADGPGFSMAVFVVLRLAVLAVHDVGVQPAHAASEALEVFWRRLWPEWDRLVAACLAPTCVNTTLRAVTISTLLDIVIFLAAAAPFILVDAAPLVDRGLTALEEWGSNTDVQSFKHKLTKAIAALEAVLRTHEPERELMREAAIKDIRADMMVTERLIIVAHQTREAHRERERERAPTRMAFR